MQDAPPADALPPVVLPPVVVTRQSRPAWLAAVLLLAADPSVWAALARVLKLFGL